MRLSMSLVDVLYALYNSESVTAHFVVDVHCCHLHGSQQAVLSLDSGTHPRCPPSHTHVEGFCLLSHCLGNTFYVDKTTLLPAIDTDYQQSMVEFTLPVMDKYRVARGRSTIAWDKQMVVTTAHLFPDGGQLPLHNLEECQSMVHLVGSNVAPDYYGVLLMSASWVDGCLRALKSKVVFPALDDAKGLVVDTVGRDGRHRKVLACTMSICSPIRRQSICVPFIFLYTQPRMWPKVEALQKWRAMALVVAPSVFGVEKTLGEHQQRICPLLFSDLGADIIGAFLLAIFLPYTLTPQYDEFVHTVGLDVSAFVALRWTPVSNESVISSLRKLYACYVRAAAEYYQGECLLGLERAARATSFLRTKAVVIIHDKFHGKRA